jgi:MOSC domain-containing protein YiiM
MEAHVGALHRSESHTFSKQTTPQLQFVAGLGVEGDAHFGATVQHRSRVAADPTQPNLRQVHLLAQEQLDAFAAAGFAVAPGDLGENVTTVGLDLHALPTGTLLQLGDGVLLALTGLRNPCGQIEGFLPGLLEHVLRRNEEGVVERRGGVLAVVLTGGTVHVGAPIAVQLPPTPHRALTRV